MKLAIQRESLLSPLQRVIGVVERKHTFPILANILFSVEADQLLITATDLEVELVGALPIRGAETGCVTLPAKKLLDIVRSLPEQSFIEIVEDGAKVKLLSESNRFSLSTLPRHEFPKMPEEISLLEQVLPQNQLLKLLSASSFAMAHQDVRYFLNGMFIEFKHNQICCVATDGHRLAKSESDIEMAVAERRSVIVPRKGVQELMKLLEPTEERVCVTMGSSHMRVKGGDFTFTTKLVDGKYPDYHAVLPQGGGIKLTAEKDALKQALVRASILSNEKFNSVRFLLEESQLKIQANNPEQEEAEIVLEVRHEGAPIEIGFNVTYLMDILSVLTGKMVHFTMIDSSSGVLVEGDAEDSGVYVVMPMCL